MNCFRLEQNLIDNIREAQLKLGYDHRPVSFNYFSRSLCHLLGISSVGEDELREFAASAAPHLGCISFRPIRDGWCITVPAEGAAFVHDTPDSSGFLADFISTVSRHGISMDDAIAVFHRYSGSVTVMELNNDEFDCLVFFSDGSPDNYRYCLAAEPCLSGGFHISYHRFIPEDYEEFGF